MQICSQRLRLLRVMMMFFLEQHALAFTPQQYLVAERHTGNVRLIICHGRSFQTFFDYGPLFSSGIVGGPPHLLQ